MSTVPTTAPRHALGLPAGSVRALHVLMVVGVICAILLIPAKQVVPIPPYLVYLLFIILGHFFASHGTVPTGTGDGHRPLYLPIGLVRLLIVFALGATVAWKVSQDPEGFQLQMDATFEALKSQPYLPLWVLGGFFVGILVRAVIGRHHGNYVIQDLEAWVSIVVLVLLLIAGIIHLTIATSLERSLSLPTWEAILAAIVAFYFGERS